MEVFANRFDAGVVAIVRGVVWEDAVLIVVRFVPRRVTGSPRRGIGYNRIQRMRRDHACELECVH